MNNITARPLIVMTAGLAALMLVSCGGSKETPEAGGSDVSVAQTIKRQSTASPADQPDASSITLVPQKPTVLTGVTAVLSGSAAVADLRWARNGVVIEGASGDRLDGSRFSKYDEITVRAGVNGSAVSASVEVANAKPSITGVRFMPELIYSGVDITAEVTGTDPDGDGVGFEYRWFVNGEEVFMATGAVLPGSEFNRDDRVTVAVTPNDGYDTGTAFTAPEIVIPNAPPVFTTTPPTRFESMVYTYGVKAVDADGDPIAFSLSDAPAGMTITGDGRLSWPLDEVKSGTYEINITADDGRGGISHQQYSLNIDIPA